MWCVWCSPWLADKALMQYRPVPPAGGDPVSVAGALSWDHGASINGETIGPWIACVSPDKPTAYVTKSMSLAFRRSYTRPVTILHTYSLPTCRFSLRRPSFLTGRWSGIHTPSTLASQLHRARHSHTMGDTSCKVLAPFTARTYPR